MANGILSSSLWQHGISHVKTEALASLKVMRVSSFILMRLWFLLQCPVKNAYLKFLSHPEVFSLFYGLVMQVLSNPVKMAFCAWSWGQLWVGGQPRGCGLSPSLWHKVPGWCGPKLPPGVPAAGRSKLFWESEQCWESSETGEAADAFFPLISSHTSARSQPRLFGNAGDSSH